ncbi:MAG TPA: hypothetical protein VNO79_06925 [Actinomycetota bacterium]|nr:hypothetical protein [Actinomycetota bacterium]
MDDLLARAIDAMHRVRVGATTAVVGGASGIGIYDVVWWVCSRCGVGWPAGVGLGRN